jgi:hypothetical protein
MDGTATVIPKRENLNIVNVTQLDKDSILVCYDNVVKIITPQGMLKINKKQVSELKFHFNIENISKLLTILEFYLFTYENGVSVSLPDSVLAFHKHGMQGRSFKNGEITQEITDTSRTYKLLGADKYVLSNFKKIYVFSLLFCRVVMLESNLIRTGTLTNEEGHDLYILAGHEASY